ncbi:alpha/beta hydrolase [Faecalicatena orotica]|uniref:Pimeloyl-ACP methyl ester carboxylesterase n=1 Tax=Faecalicatena orotica TaxID=1544 RepID=A0A2Y9BB78_9FIRM|nr:alpha/beta hydrolase [Faecalicatena orotica]PWJ30168.1 pimeloyl-ACP methyl ester carboxylesterase [Faecalicatena orotica]SSA55157.1 Pimeloyl-ACP methyl ester carboxylesterase [Faecalicatena orotica]
MQAPGKIVKVNDTYMHVYRVPKHPTDFENTIVFLSGSGTECPTYDFKPLWHLLAGKVNMVVVERPGYGWSGQTGLPRDIDTVLEETREALRKADITGPFIPAAHSMSGLEAIYWSQKYPEEIKAIIGLDMAVPKAYDSLVVPRFLSRQVWLAHLLRKPAAKIMVKTHPAVKYNHLNKKQQAEMYMITSKQLLSKNMIDEINLIKQNAHKAGEGKCPFLPVLCFLSHDKGNLKQIPEWGKIHREYFSENENAKFIDLPCGHYVHREEPEMIAESITRFLNFHGLYC